MTEPWTPAQRDRLLARVTRTSMLTGVAAVVAAAGLGYGLSAAAGAASTVASSTTAASTPATAASTTATTGSASTGSTSTATTTVTATTGTAAATSGGS